MVVNGFDGCLVFHNCRQLLLHGQYLLLHLPDLVVLRLDLVLKELDLVVQHELVLVHRAYLATVAVLLIWIGVGWIPRALGPSPPSLWQVQLHPDPRYIDYGQKICFNIF